MMSNDYAQLPDWVSVHQAAKHLQVGLSSMYEMVRSGEIASKKFGRLVRIPKSALIHSEAKPPSVQQSPVSREQVEAVVDMVLDILIKRLRGSRL